MCKVQVSTDKEGLIGEPTLAESSKLGIHSATGLRLSCQTLLTGNPGTVTVEVPEDPLKAIIRRKLAEQEEDSLWQHRNKMNSSIFKCGIVMVTEEEK